MNRKTEQKTEKAKSRFNIADVVIIIVIVAIITALGLRIYNIFGAEEDICRVEVTFRVTGISEEYLSPSEFSEKTKLYYSETDAEVGYIKNYKISDMTEFAYDENGTLVEAKVPGKKTVTGTLILTCEKTEKGFFLDGTKFLTVGEKIHLYTTTRDMMFEITSIKEFTGETSASTVATTQAAAQ